MNNKGIDIGDLDWLRLPIPIHDVELLRQVVSERIATVPRFCLHWDGSELEPVFWQRGTVALETEAMALWEALKAAGEPIRKEEAFGAFFGTSFSEALADAAEYFGISYSTLHRIVRPPPARASKSRGPSRRKITVQTLYRLRRARFAKKEAEFRVNLDRAVLAPKLRRVLREYVAYIDREIERMNVRRKAKHGIIFPKYLPTKKNPDGSPKISAEWQARSNFYRRASALGAPATRARLGDLRVYDSLVGWKGFYRSLSKVRLRSLVKAGYRRERQLLEAEFTQLRREINAP